jgi:copper chaperone
LTEDRFSVPDVSCVHCKSAIEDALNPLEGIQLADVDIEGRVVTVSYDEGVIDRQRVVESIEGAGYPVAT